MNVISVHPVVALNVPDEKSSYIILPKGTCLYYTATGNYREGIIIFHDYYIIIPNKSYYLIKLEYNDNNIILSHPEVKPYCENYPYLVLNKVMIGEKIYHPQWNNGFSAKDVNVSMCPWYFKFE